MERDYYTILGLKEGASPAEVHDAYRRLARAYHPDVSGGDTSGSFREVQEAWDTLGDAQRRRDYDERIQRERQTAAAPPPWSGTTGRPLWSRKERADHGPARVLHLKLEMGRAEAAAGGRVAVDLPAVVLCPWCDGSGGGMLFGCSSCGGEGYFLAERRFLLEVPPGLCNGDVFQVPLPGYSLFHNRLVIHVVVG